MEAFENILECYTRDSTLVLKGFSAESSAWLEYFFLGTTGPCFYRVVWLCYLLLRARSASIMRSTYVSSGK